MERRPQFINIGSNTVVRILLIITAFVASIWLIYILHRELVWVGVAIFLAVALDPAVKVIAKLLRGSRLWGTIVVFVVFVAVIGFLGASLIPPLVSQTEDLAKQLPHYIADVQNSHSYIGNFVQHYKLVQHAKAIQSHLLSGLSSGGGFTLGLVKSLFSGLTAVATILVLTFFMLLEGPQWMTLGWRYVPKPEQSRSHRLGGQMYRIISSYVTGNLIIALVMAVITSVIAVIFSVPYAIPLGIVSGFTTLIPIVGGFISLIIVCGVAIFTSLTATIVLAVFYLIYMLTDGHILRPLVFGKSLEMSPLSVTLALVFGTALGGIIGALVAIPVAACLGVIVADFTGRSRLWARTQEKAAKTTEG